MKKTVIAGGIALALGLAFNASAELAAPAPAAAASRPVSGSSIVVKGADVVKVEPIRLAVGKAAFKDADFTALASAVQAHPTWTVNSLQSEKTLTKVTLLSAGGKLTMTLMVSTAMAQEVKLSKGSVVTGEVTASGKTGLVVLKKDGAPIGFMPSDSAGFNPKSK